MVEGPNPTPVRTALEVCHELFNSHEVRQLEGHINQLPTDENCDKLTPQEGLGRQKPGSLALISVALCARRSQGGGGGGGIKVWGGTRWPEEVPGYGGRGTTECTVAVTSIRQPFFTRLSPADIVFPAI